MMKNILKLNNISLNYHSAEGETIALSDINIEVNEGEFVSIVGPSGCGKTTILSLISGLIKPSAGEVYLCGEQICAPTTEVGYMLQRDQLFEWRTVLRNITIGLEIRHQITRENLDRINALIEKYGLKEFAGHYPNQLSGGMRQRAALIRTLAVSPRLLLLDEPFSALDYQTRLNVCDDVHKIITDEGKTAVLVTHDLSEAISMSDKIFVLSKRPGTVKSVHKMKNTDKTPFERRECDDFQQYFDKIWKELQE